MALRIKTQECYYCGLKGPSVAFNKIRSAGFAARACPSCFKKHRFMARVKVRSKQEYDKMWKKKIKQIERQEKEKDKIDRIGGLDEQAGY